MASADFASPQLCVAGWLHLGLCNICWAFLMSSLHVLGKQALTVMATRTRPRASILGRSRRMEHSSSLGDKTPDLESTLRTWN